jgi:hypothetical protein
MRVIITMDWSHSVIILLVLSQKWLNLHFKFLIHHFYYCVHHIFFVGTILMSCSVFLWYRTWVTKNIRTKDFCVTGTSYVSHLVVPHPFHYQPKSYICWGNMMPNQLRVQFVFSLFFIASSVRWFVQYLLCRANYCKLKTIFPRHSVTKGCYIPGWTIFNYKLCACEICHSFKSETAL